jgi:hypothetical protein
MERTSIQKAAMLFGLVFLVVGIGGLIPGVTTEYKRLTEFGGTGAKELGFLGTNLLEVAVHLLYAVAGFAMARTVSSARAYFLGGGAIYLVIWVYGLLIELSGPANIFGLNAASNWVHFTLGIVMVAVGLLLDRRTEAVTPA